MYTITLENFEETYAEIEELYRDFYHETYSDDSSPFNMLKDDYIEANRDKWLLHFVLRKDDIAIGYCNMWLAQDLRNGDLIAQEDSIFVSKQHRNGIGIKLAKTVIEDLRSRGVKRLIIAALDNTHAGRIWERLGFKRTAVMMEYNFEGN